MKKIIIAIVLIFSMTSCLSEKKVDNQQKININNKKEKINTLKAEENWLANGGFSWSISVESDFKK